jgi:hypothetical protein
MCYFIINNRYHQLGEYIMGIGPHLIIQGTILGSFIVAAFGMMVTSSVRAEELTNESVVAAAIILPAEESLPSDELGSLPEADSPPAPEELSTEELSTDELFEASIAYTPETIETQASNLPASSVNDCRVSSSFAQSILQWCTLITTYADYHGLPPDLVAAVMLQESGGKPLAYSHSGAVGLMQVMPRDGIATKFMCINGPCFTNRPTIAELQDPEFNIAYGTKMLAGLASRFGNYRDALKSYGPMDVGYGYADKVLAIYHRHSQ